MPQKEYNYRRKKGVTVPFGYEIDAHDPKLLKPIPEQLDALEQAIQYLKTSPLREVARWLSARTGRSITHMGLSKIVKARRKRKPQD